MPAPRRSPPRPDPRRSRGRGVALALAFLIPAAASDAPAALADPACLDANEPATLTGEVQLTRIPATASPPRAPITYARLILDRPICLRDPFETDRDIFSVALEPVPPPPPPGLARALGRPPRALPFTVTGHLIFNGAADHPPEQAILFAGDRPAA